MDSAFREKTAKLTPSDCNLVPRGRGLPGRTAYAGGCTSPSITLRPSIRELLRR